MAKQTNKIKKTTKVDNRNGYRKIETTKKYKGKKHRSITYETTDDEQFTALDTINQFYDYTNKKYKNDKFFIRVLTPLGWRTVASNSGIQWGSYEDYFDGKVKNPDKFVEDVEKINIVII